MSMDLFLVLQPVREVVMEARIMLAPLARLDSSYLNSLEAYYNEDADAALLCLCFGDRVSEPALQRRLALDIEGLGFPIVLPAAMTKDDRHHFYADHLPRYDHYVQQYATFPNDPVVLRILDMLEAQSQAVEEPITTEANFNLPMIEEALPLRSPVARRAPSEWTNV